MHRFYSALRKEFLIMIRDIPGLAILFIMPVLLIMIVTLAQQNALKTSRENKTEVIFIDEARNGFSALLRQDLDSSGLWKLITRHNGTPLDLAKAKELIGQGDYPAGIVLSLRDTSILLLTDPALQPAYKNSLAGSLTFFIRGTQSRIAIENLVKTLAPAMGSGLNGLIGSGMRNMPPVTEIYATKKNATVRPSIIQNNVPGFILFAMFFIVIPLSGSMITEKNEGSFGRLRTLPVKVSVLLSSKVVLFLFVCLLQFCLMILTGTWILPALTGMPALQLGSHFGAILVATVAAGLAAIGFGLLIGGLATSPGQAALFGSVMVVILGVISGTFLPVYLMPEPIRALSLISPIRWGIDNYLDLFIREGTIGLILPNILKLVAFFVFAMIISIAIFARRK
jgi:ABC-2 type transport system permease protein